MLKEIKKHIDACDLVDENQPRPKLLPSCAAGNTGHSFRKHVRGMLKFSVLAQDWSGCTALDSESSTENFPSMDAAIAALCFYCKYSDRGSFLCEECGAPALACDGKNVMCDRQWKDPGSKEQYMSEASKVRANCVQQGPCRPSCKSCHKARFTDKLKHGRSHYHFAPHLKNSGNYIHALSMFWNLILQHHQWS